VCFITFLSLVWGWGGCRTEGPCPLSARLLSFNTKWRSRSASRPSPFTARNELPMPIQREGGGVWLAPSGRFWYCAPLPSVVEPVAPCAYQMKYTGPRYIPQWSKMPYCFACLLRRNFLIANKVNKDTKVEVFTEIQVLRLLSKMSHFQLIVFAVLYEKT